MKLLQVFIFYYLSLGLLCSVSAKPLTTEKILFSSDRDGNSEIYMMNPDGSQQVKLTNHRADDLRPTCSPTGENILFISERSGMHDLYIMGADGKNVRPVFRTAGVYRGQPTWSPDGKKIAYDQRASNAGRTAVYTAKVDGTLVNRVVKIQEGEAPTWSSDGTEIAYVVREEIRWASRQIRFINLKTRQQETLLPDEFPRMFQPTWSPVGNKIAFVWHRPEHRQQSIFIVNRDGSCLQQIIEVGANTPAWSPSGDQLVYSQVVGNKSQIFKINLVTRRTTQLTHNGNNFLGNWFDPLALPVSPQPQLLTTTWGEMKIEN